MIDDPAYPTLADVLRMTKRSTMADVNVAIPARIITVEGDARVTAQPTVQARRRSPEGALLTFTPAPIPGVPVLYPGGGGWALTWPLERGHTGLLVFADRSLDEWLLTGSREAEPLHQRIHAYTDAVFVPGLRPYGDLTAKQLDPGAIVVAGDAVHLGSGGLTSAEALAYLDSVQSQLTALKSAINGAAVIANDGGAAFKSNIMTALSSWPSVSGTSKTLAE